MTEAQRPVTPADLAHLRRAAPPVSPPTKPRFKTAPDYPRKGNREAVTWADTGILISLGVKAHLPDRFVQLYGGLLRTGQRVVAEVRGLSDEPDPRTDHDKDVRTAARAARQALLITGHERLKVRSLRPSDLPMRDAITQQLKGLSADPRARHGGEAELVTLAAVDAADTGAPQVLLSNDAGASVVADARGVPTRHIGDVLREMACADNTLTPGDLYDELTSMTAVSRPQGSVIPRSSGELVCQRTDGACAGCDSPPRALPGSPPRAT